MIRALVLFAAVYVVLIAQEFLPALPFFANARLLLVPVIFCYGALWLPFPAMLGLALWTGLLSDLANLHVIGDQVEIGLGWSILFYVFTGTLLQMLREAFAGGRWEIHALASGALTLLLLLGQYAMVCLRRESFYFDGTVFWHIAGPALAALVLAPLFYFFFRLFPGGFHQQARRGRRLTP
jgi:hypothetical protein